MRARIAPPALLLALAVGAARAADPPAAVTREFRAVAESAVTLDGEGLPGPVNSVTDFRYSWTQTGREKVLRVSEATMTATAGGTEVRKITMSRAGMFGTEQGKKIERKYDGAPEAFQKLLQGAFDTPLCTLAVDAAGREAARKAIVAPGALNADKWTAYVTSLGHPFAPADKAEWKTTATISAGQGDASGELTFTRAKGGPGVQTVKAAGVLRPTPVKAGDRLAVTDGTYTVAGELKYDPDRNEWVSSRYEIDVAITLSKGDKGAGTGKGKMVLTFELLPEKK